MYNTQKYKEVVGAHVGVKGELKSSLIKAAEIGADAIQIFGSSPMQWNVKDREEKEFEEFRKEFKASNVSHVFLHAPYLINLASLNEEIYEKSISTLVSHLNIAEKIGAVGLVVHLGSVGKDSNRDKKDAVKQITEGIKKVLEGVPGHTYFIMENTAGAGGTFGVNKEELGWILDSVKSDRLKICIDTAHAFASGIMDIKNKEDAVSFLNEWEEFLGENKIIVIHANDSKVEFNTNKDRHENIGEGYIGKEIFKHLAKDKRAAALPWILEVPGFDNNGPDAKNINILKKDVMGL